MTHYGAIYIFERRWGPKRDFCLLFSRRSWLQFQELFGVVCLAGFRGGCVTWGVVVRRWTRDRCRFQCSGQCTLCCGRTHAYVPLSPPTNITVGLSYCLTTRCCTVGLGKRGRSPSLYHSRQSGIVIKPRLDCLGYTIVGFVRQECRRKLWKR